MHEKGHYLNGLPDGHHSFSGASKWNLNNASSIILPSMNRRDFLLASVGLATTLALCGLTGMADTPLTSDRKPLLTIDIREHAYCLDY